MRLTADGRVLPCEKAQSARALPPMGVAGYDVFGWRMVRQPIVER